MAKCYTCLGRATEKHHIYYGKNRQNSDKYGFVVFLCSECHRGTYGVHGKQGHSLDIKLKQRMQKEFEKTNTRKEFIEIIGRSYL